MGLHRLLNSAICHAVLKWHDFSRARNCRKINAGFSSRYAFLDAQIEKRSFPWGLGQACGKSA